MREQYIEYRDGDALLEGFLCYDEAQPGPRPTVLINHAWNGRDDFVERKARRLAWQGYACFALDNFGKGKRGTTNEECSALMTPFMNDRSLLLRRLKSGLATAKAMP
ncbi:MAG TPA: dienelactone hydrolase family protein, partial [Steroidobacteraceae bacterium]|nr:dienelactone hydrolase family protein [Steroidobacteraceae bacterium]